MRDPFFRILQRPFVAFHWAAPLVFLALFGCNADEELPRLQTDLPFSNQGTLTFVDAAGSLITSINIEIAEGDSARTRGLMQRRDLEMNTGMLFVFDQPDTLSFWMENTFIPLEMMFVAADSGIVNIERARPLSRDPVRSIAPAQYVVEVRAGFSKRFGISPGAYIRWSRDEQQIGR